MKLRMSLIGLALAGAVVMFSLSACGGSSSSAASGGSTASTASVAASGHQTYTLEVLNGKLATKFGIVAVADGIGHDTFAPSHMTVKAGEPVTMTVYNYDEGPHTYTISKLNINEQIKAHISKTQPSVTTFTVTFPKAGTYRWFCELPCDAGQGGYAMTADRGGHGPAQDGFMAGYVSVI
jgi:plastocyanin